jgi:hypothetical protein
MADGHAQLQTLSLLEQLRDAASGLRGTTSELHERVDHLLRRLADPSRIADLPTDLPYRIELWDRHEAKIRWVVSASNNLYLAHGAYERALAHYPEQHFLIRNRAQVIRRSNDPE